VAWQLPRSVMVAEGVTRAGDVPPLADAADEDA
jgi:hypothetical protein